jgi:hypothetical protein
VALPDEIRDMSRRNKMRKVIIIGALLGTLGATQNAHAVEGGYHAASKFEQVKAACELTADGLRDGMGIIIGSDQMVAATTFGRGLGSLIKHARDYDSCMTLHGYAKN